MVWLFFRDQFLVSVVTGHFINLIINNLIRGLLRQLITSMLQCLFLVDNDTCN